MRDAHHRSGSCGLIPFGNGGSAGRAPNKGGNKEKGLVTSVGVQLPNGEVSPPDQIDHGGDTDERSKRNVPRQKLHATILEA